MVCAGRYGVSQLQVCLGARRPAGRGTSASCFGVLLHHSPSLCLGICIHSPSPPTENLFTLLTPLINDYDLNIAKGLSERQQEKTL